MFFAPIQVLETRHVNCRLVVSRWIKFLLLLVVQGKPFSDPSLEVSPEGLLKEHPKSFNLAGGSL